MPNSFRNEEIIEAADHFFYVFVRKQVALRLIKNYRNHIVVASFFDSLTLIHSLIDTLEYFEIFAVKLESKLIFPGYNSIIRRMQ